MLKREKEQDKVKEMRGKRERELEGKVREMEAVAQEQRKQMGRLQEVNRELIDKVKLVETTLLEREGGD